MEIKKIVGIISYLPDEEEIRKVRLERCVNLINQVTELFKLPMILVAQNWTNEDTQKISDRNNIEIHTYDKLGITCARETLRKIFVQKDFDYMITMDDDLELIEDRVLIDAYLNMLDGKKWLEVQNFLMNLLAIPKDIYEKEPFDLNTDAEKGTGYEDWIYVMNLKDKYLNRYVKISNSFTKEDRHTMTLDKYSTWKTSEEKDQTEISWKKIHANQAKVRADKNENSSK